MTQIFTGTGAGLHGSSLAQLGSYGPKGIASLGQGGSSVFVNAANGNLFLKQSDGFLANSNLGLDLFHSYNSRNAGAWRFNTDTHLAFEGKANAVGSLIIRTDEDGHDSRFIYNAEKNAYLAEDGSTAKLSFDGTGWNYQENNSPITSYYNREGQLTHLSDRDGHELRFSYNNGQLTNITDNSRKQTITWSFSQGLLRDVTFQSDSQTVHHLYYEYDAQQRLNCVRRDLGNGKTYWIAYDYTGDTNLISDIRQSDGTTLHIDYDANNRIQRLVDGEGRITRYEYLQGKTIVTNGLNERWIYYYDEEARLTGIDGPENYHIRYHYKDQHLDSITQGNLHWFFNYNEAGDCIRIESPSGEVTQRSYDNEHRLLSETHYQTFDANHHPALPQTAHYIYNQQGHLRFNITADGVVTECRYDLNGNRISSRCYMQSRWQGQEINLDALTLWSHQQNPQDINLIDYHYDWRGCLHDELHYTQVNEHGEGIITTDTLRTASRYDAAGLLIEKSNGLSTTHYLYDDLGRLIKTVDNQQHIQTIDYDDSHQRIIKTDANGLQTISIFDKSGLLLSTQQLDATHPYGTKRYEYDAAGQLISETDVSGKTRHLFYDSQGRLLATFSSNDHVTEYRYDVQGHCIQTHQYQQRVHASDFSNYAAIKPHATNQDRISQVIYNAYNQIGWTVDATGAVISFQYDAQDRITTKTAYAHRLTDYQPGTQLTSLNIILNPSNDDRTITYYYDANGRLQAEINGEGATTAYHYNAQGHLTEKICYRNKMTGLRTGNWMSDAPTADDNDIHTYSLYNTADLKIADIDGERYLTEYVYDSHGLLTETISYYTQLKTIRANSSLSTLRPNQHRNDHHTTYQYNDLNQRIEESTSSGLITTYAYNLQGLIINETRTDSQTHAIRNQQYRYDAQGRLIQQLNAEGIAYLAQNVALNPAQIESIWQQHSLHFSYDLAGHLISKTTALNETTHYIYDDAGLLTYTITPTGAVTEHRYNAFQQVEITIRYSAYINHINANLTDIKQHLLENPNLDEVTHYQYNVLGLLISQQKGNGSTQLTTYNAFGERSQTAQHTNTYSDILTDYQYDHRGLLRFKNEDTAGINKTFTAEYDAFGWIEKEADGRHGLTVYTHNKRGESILFENQAHETRKTEYDAFNRILTLDGKTSVRYIYDDQHHMVILDRNDIGSRVITYFNALGDKLSVIDGNHKTTTFQYNTAGQLIHIDAPEHAVANYSYDTAGNVVFQQDIKGQLTRFTYDAEGRVLTKIVAPDTLNITTTYTYDALGRQLQVIDAGRCTKFVYDNQGHLIQTRQDPDGLNLTTTFDYNDVGQLIRETHLNPGSIDKVTAYTYDALGRRLSSIIDPNGLQLVTAYTYDNNDNVLSQTDPNQNTTHYVYDANNRLRYYINPLGVVTEHRYDNRGNTIQTTTYANQITCLTQYDETSLAAMLQPDIQIDHHAFFRFDEQSRLIISYDGLGYATTYEYDANDNLLVKWQFDSPYPLEELIAGGTIPPIGWMRSTYFVYDGLNQERFRINDNGHLTEFCYNSSGQIIQQNQYACLISVADADVGFTPSVEQIQAHIRLKPGQDQHIRYAYDQAGRLTMQATAAGVITAYEYDAAGYQTASHQYATRLDTARLTDPQWQQLVQESSADRITRAIYDAAGRAIYRISPTGHVVEHNYDAAGNVLTEIAHATRWPLNTPDNTAHINQFEYDAIGRLVSQTDATLHTIRYTYDKNSNVATKTDMNLAVWEYRYNANNQLIETCAPTTTFNTYSNGSWHQETRAVSTQKTYDSFGNLIREIRDAGGMNQTVHYTYDANNRKLSSSYPDIAISNATPIASNDRQEIRKTLTETCVYNAYGEVIEQRDRAGHSRHYAYDGEGQQIFSVNAEGAVTRYGYDAFGNVTTKISYATRLSSTDYHLESIARYVRTDSHDRHEYYNYDQDHHLIETRKDVIRSFNPCTDLYHMLSPTTRFTYNAFGDVITQAVQLTNDDWAITTHTYDNDGLKIATLDAEQYLTSYSYNAFGLVNEETQYAMRGSSPASSSKDRTVSYLYDVKGQLIQKTLKNVAVSRLTGQGAQYETLTRDLTSYYGYDAMGNMVSTTDPEGHTAYSSYNVQGQLITKVGMQTQAGRAATTYSYDALGQLVNSRQWANGAHVTDNGQVTLNQASASDIVLQSIYDANGHVTEKIDGTGHVTHYSYDANGNIARCWQLVNQALISDKHFSYDGENHLLQTATMDTKGLRATEDAQYNAFGEAIKKGVDGNFTTQIDYDTSGRVWRSNIQGYFQLYVYDLSDHVTSVLTSTNGWGTSFSANGIDLAQSWFETYINFNTGDSRYNVQHHNNTYDALGHLIGQSQEDAMASGSKLDPIPHRATQTQTVDRWGNVLTTTNAHGYTTRYNYNALNAVTEQILPEVSIVDEHGIAHHLAPINHYAIDSFGRTIAMTDANGHTIGHLYDAEGRIIQDINARNYHRDKTYNLLGQLITQSNEQGTLTSYTYDAENRLLSVITPQTAQYYQYDGMGQIVLQTNTAGIVQTMAYDELGHLIQKTDLNGTTSFEYDTAGHKTAEHDANGHTSTWRYNQQGRVQEHTDLGGHRTEYTYNTNGLLRAEQSSSGKDIRYLYYSGGQIMEYADFRHKETAKYTYDIEGNVTSKITGRYGDWINEIDHYQYDEMGRMSHVKRLKEYSTNPNIPTPDNTLLSIDYEYDAVGNIRDTRVIANYSGYQATGHTDYYTYDENNRIIINKGQLINNQINITGSQGTFLTYDNTGNIIDVQTFEGGIFQRYNYWYNTDNLLILASKNNHAMQSKRYSAGLLEEEVLFDNTGHGAQRNVFIYTNGRLIGQMTNDFEHNMTVETRYYYDKVGNMIALTTKDPNATQTHQYSYELWDSYLQKTDNLTLSYKKKPTTFGQSTHTYDANGLLREVNNTQTPYNTIHYYASNHDGIHARKDGDGETNYLTVAGKTIGDLRLNKQKIQTLNVYGASSPPEIQQNNLGAYTLCAGDTLDSIALQVYGDSSLWYLIADANGITDRFARVGEKGSPLHAGMRLNLPSVTKSQHNTNNTHKVLSSSDWIGDTAAVALTPAPPSHKNQNSFWKTIAKIAVVVTAAVVMVMSAGALAVLAAGTGLSGIGIGTLISTGLSALGGTALTGIGSGASLGLTSTLAVGFGAGFASSVAGQTAANLLHLQNGIDMQGALMAGLGSAVTAGVSHLSNASTVYRELRSTLQNWSPSGFNILNATEMMERDSITQGLNLALNHHQHFDWLELGVSSVTAGVMGSQTAQEWGQLAQEKVGRVSAFATSELQALATGAATGHFDALQILQDNLGNAASASLLQQPLQPSPAESQDPEDITGYCPIPDSEEDNYSTIPEGTWERLHRESEMRKHLEQMNAQYMNEGDGGIMERGSIFGVVGDAAYGEDYQLLIGQGALAIKPSLNKLGLYDVDYSLLTIAKPGSPYRKDQIVSQSHYYNSPGSPIWGDASQDIQIQAVDALITSCNNKGLSVRDTAHVLAIARHESGFNPYAAAGTTSASGLGQFIDSTGKGYGINKMNRWNMTTQANALVDHYIDNKIIVERRKLPESYIYKFHHDGLLNDYGGLKISNKYIVSKIGEIQNVIKKLFL